MLLEVLSVLMSAIWGSHCCTYTSHLIKGLPQALCCVVTGHYIFLHCKGIMTPNLWILCYQLRRYSYVALHFLLALKYVVKAQYQAPSSSLNDFGFSVFTKNLLNFCSSCYNSNLSTVYIYIGIWSMQMSWATALFIWLLNASSWHSQTGCEWWLATLWKQVYLSDYDHQLEQHESEKGKQLAFILYIFVVCKLHGMCV